MKFGTTVLYKKRYRKHGFRKSRLIDIHTLLLTMILSGNSRKALYFRKVHYLRSETDFSRTIVPVGLAAVTEWGKKRKFRTSLH
jgi:hypothetical protein